MGFGTQHEINELLSAPYTVCATEMQGWEGDLDFLSLNSVQSVHVALCSALQVVTSGLLYKHTEEQERQDSEAKMEFTMCLFCASSEKEILN